MGSSKTEGFLLLALLGVAGFVLYQVYKGAAALGGAAIKGARVLTAPVAQALANAWSAMTLAPSMSVLGNVLWPDSTQTPLAQLAVKQDTLGNVYVASPENGLLFQLQPSDLNGNWPAVQITDPAQIGKSLNAQNVATQPLPVDFGVSNASSW